MVKIPKNFLIIKQSATNALKPASKRSNQKTAEATDDLIGNRSARKITKVSKASSQNNSKTVTTKQGNIGLDREIPRERYISSEKKTANY